MTTQVLRGKIKPLALVDVLAYLGRNKETGVLHITRDNVKKSILLSEGNIIFARSNQTQDRLGDILLAQNLIDQEQYDRGTDLVYQKGFRHGRALVEIGAISPKTLWVKIQEQIEIIACSVIPWDSGQFEFIKQQIKQKESITVKKSLLDLITDVIRNLDNRSLFRAKFPDDQAVFHREPAPSEHGIKLDPHESYLLEFFDGKNTLADVCRLSEYGEAESLRVVYLLLSMGLISTENAKTSIATHVRPLHPLILKFNNIFEFLNRYLSEHVGKVGTNMLKKYFEGIRNAHPRIFENVKVLDDGRLSPDTIQDNMEKLALADRDAEMVLDDALNEYLNVGILCVKKVLGTDHESRVVREISAIN